MRWKIAIEGQVILSAPGCLFPALIVPLLPLSMFISRMAFLSLSHFLVLSCTFFYLMGTAIISTDGQFDDGFNIGMQHGDVSLRLAPQGPVPGWPIPCFEF